MAIKTSLFFFFFFLYICIYDIVCVNAIVKHFVTFCLWKAPHKFYFLTRDSKCQYVSYDLVLCTEGV